MNWVSEITQFFKENGITDWDGSLTNDGSVYFHKMAGKYSIHLELWFDENMETVCNLYVNKELIFAYGGNISDVLKELKNKLTP